jgi:toxin CcdB
VDLTSKNLKTRVVVPLLSLDDVGTPIADLNPIVRWEARDYVFVAQSLATLSLRELGERVGNLRDAYGDAFGYALDILLTGF